MMTSVSGSAIDVRSGGALTLAGGYSLSASGWAFFRAPGIEIAGPVSVGAYSVSDVVSDKEMRLTGASAALGTDAHMRLWSTNLALDPTNRLGYTYRVYGAAYGTTNNPANRGIGWFYGVSSPYSTWSSSPTAPSPFMPSSVLIPPASAFQMAVPGIRTFSTEPVIFRSELESEEDDAVAPSPLSLSAP
jgi:hypothetical protein